MVQAMLVHEGHSIDYTPETDVPAGKVVVQGTLIGIAAVDIPANRKGALRVDGVHAIDKVTGAITAGALVYWDADANPVSGTAGAGALTTTATSNTLAGKAVAASASDDAKVLVLLNR